MKKYIAGLLAAFLLPACSEEKILPDKEEEHPRPENPNEDNPSASDSTETEAIPTIRLFVNKTKANIFELARFSFYSEGDQMDSTALMQTPIHAEENLRTYYDSLVWSVPDLKIRLNLFQKRNDEGVQGWTMTSQWSNNFFLPGHYEMWLTGYQGDSIISRDSLRMEIVNGKEFLGYNWEEITKPDEHAISYENLQELPYEFRTYADYIKPYIMQGMPTLTLSLLWKGSEEQPQDQEKQILTDYINHLYNDGPVLPTDDNWQDAFDLFGIRLEAMAEVAAIWIEPDARIALVREQADEWEEEKGWKIYGEPLLP